MLPAPSADAASRQSVAVLHDLVLADAIVVADAVAAIVAGDAIVLVLVYVIVSCTGIHLHFCTIWR